MDSQEFLARVQGLDAQVRAACPYCRTGASPKLVDGPGVRWRHLIDENGALLLGGAGMLVDCPAAALLDELEGLRRLCG